MRSKYKGVDSVVLENKTYRVEILPDPGGKMVSLIDRKNDYEFFVQKEWSEYRKGAFAGSYVEAECSGFDDMFPTIDECQYENEPWKGTVLADHGEVWSLPWQILAENEQSLKLSVHGIRFPYILEKQIALTDTGVRLDYVLSNPTPFDFDYLWGGHMMINVEEGMKVVLPDDFKTAVSVFSNGVSKFGDTHVWPHLRGKNGESYRGDIVRNKSAQGFEKYYFTDKVKEGNCLLEYPDGKKRLRISWSVDTVPYLGILMNENAWDGLYNIFVEPCSVCFDRPDVARQQGQRSVCPKFGEVRWNMTLSWQ